MDTEHQRRGIFGTRSVAVAAVVGLPVAALSLIVAVYQASVGDSAAPVVTTTPAPWPSRSAVTVSPSKPSSTTPVTAAVVTTTPADSPRTTSPTIETEPVTPKVRWTGTSWLSSGGLDVDARPP